MMPPRNELIRMGVYIVIFVVVTTLVLHGVVTAQTQQARQLRGQAAQLKIQAARLKTIADEQAKKNAAQDRAQCESRRDGRDVLRQVITKSYSAGGSPNFESIASFADVEPGARQFLLDYEHQLAQATPEQRKRIEQRRDELLALVPPVTDCQ